MIVWVQSIYVTRSSDIRSLMIQWKLETNKCLNVRSILIGQDLFYLLILKSIRTSTAAIVKLIYMDFSLTSIEINDHNSIGIENCRHEWRNQVSQFYTPNSEFCPDMRLHLDKTEIKKTRLHKVTKTMPKHSTEIRGLCLMKWPSEMLQNLPYFWNTKT